jgi:hypothetical protein
LLSAILAADLFFFLLFRTYFPQDWNLIFQRLPWSDDLEKMLATFIGFMIALLAALSITRAMLQHLFRSA